MKTKSHSKTIPLLLSLSFGGLLACSAEVEVEATGDIVIGEVCTQTQECIPGSMCFNEFCVGAGSLRTSLSFFEDTDLDLHLLTPNGVEIYFINDRADGGVLDVDQCISSCGADTAHVENINFDGAPPRGTYEVWVENFDGRAAANFSIEIAGDGISTSFSGSVAAQERAVSERMSFVF